ncbi:MAG: hypothetical protein JNL62_30115, partial [Bryobacterales bacterium]|nr:hypothetical protein [Bryobacterales bacterium]
PRSQLLLPYPAYRNVTVTAPHWGNSIYHGVQITLQRRFAQGFSLMASYTNGKLIDDLAAGVSSGFTGLNQGVQGTQTYYNRRVERSLSPGDVSQRLVVSYVWEVPFLKGNPILGGWQLSGSSTMNTGAPLAIRGAQNFAADRPNSTGQSAKLTGDQRSADRWFDTSAFTLPPLYTFGNVGRVL